MGWEACRIMIEAGRGFVQEETKKYMKLIAMASTMGISMVLALVIAIAIGYYLDKWFKTSPLFFLIFMVLGIIAGFRNIYVIMKRAEKDLK
jgi:ATP synthase protein I